MLLAKCYLLYIAAIWLHNLLIMVLVASMAYTRRGQVFHLTGIALQTEVIQKVSIWKKNILGLEPFHLAPWRYHWDSQLWRNAPTQLLQGHQPQPGLSRVTWASSKHSHHYSTLCSWCSQDLGKNRIHCHAQPGHHVMAARHVWSGRAAPHEGPSACTRTSTEEGVILPEESPIWGMKSVLLLAHSKQHRPTPCWREGPSRQQFNFPYQESPRDRVLEVSLFFIPCWRSFLVHPLFPRFQRYPSLINLPGPPLLQVNRDSPENPSQIDYQALLQDEIWIIPVPLWHSVQGLQIQRSLLVWLANKHHRPHLCKEERKCLVLA